jgi:hypothetical protein
VGRRQGWSLPLRASPSVATSSTATLDQINNPATTQLRNSNTTPTDTMADQIKQTRNAINAKKQAVQGQERERVEWADQVSTRSLPPAHDSQA